MRNLSFMNGLLVAKFPPTHLETENVLPTYEEVQTFMAQQRDPQARAVMRRSLELLNDPAKRLRKNLARGDRVHATEGEFKSLVGVVIDVDAVGDTVKVDFSGQQPSLRDAVLFKAHELRKHFEVGDAVEVLLGRRKGATGTVLRLEDHVAHLITHGTNEEIAVWGSDLRASSNLGGDAQRIFKRQAGLDKFDLVTFNDGRSAGLVLRVGAGSCTVLDTEGCVRTLQSVQVTTKLTKTYVAKNAFEQEIRPRYTVKVLSGRRKSRVTRPTGAGAAGVRQSALFVRQAPGGELGSVRGERGKLLGHQPS